MIINIKITFIWLKTYSTSNGSMTDWKRLSNKIIDCELYKTYKTGQIRGKSTF